MVKTQDRVTSFSVRPTDEKAIDEINKLKAYSNKTGISFSHLMIKAITNFNEELCL